jgi:hypothetical protein
MWVARWSVSMKKTAAAAALYSEPSLANYRNRDDGDWRLGVEQKFVGDRRSLSTSDDTDEHGSEAANCATQTHFSSGNAVIRVAASLVSVFIRVIRGIRG